MPKFSGSGPGLSRLAHIRRQAQKIRLQEAIEARSYELASAKCQWRKARNERDSLERFTTSRGAGWMSNGALQGCLARRDALVLSTDNWERQCRHRQERLNEAIAMLNEHFPSLWLQVWRWITRSTAK